MSAAIIRQSSGPLAEALNSDTVAGLRAAHAVELKKLHRQIAILTRASRKDVQLERAMFAWLLYAQDEMVVTVGGRRALLETAIAGGAIFGEMAFVPVAEAVVNILHGQIPDQLCGGCGDVSCLGCKSGDGGDLQLWPDMPEYVKLALAEARTAREMAAEVIV